MCRSRTRWGSVVLFREEAGDKTALPSIERTDRNDGNALCFCRQRQSGRGETDSGMVHAGQQEECFNPEARPLTAHVSHFAINVQKNNSLKCINLQFHVSLTHENPYGRHWEYPSILFRVTGSWFISLAQPKRVYSVQLCPAPVRNNKVLAFLEKCILH